MTEVGVSRIENLSIETAKLVGIVDHKRWSFILHEAFKYDRDRVESVFSSETQESIEKRLEVLNILFIASGADPEKVSYIIGLWRLAAYSYAIHKGATHLEYARNGLAGYLSTIEGKYVEIAQKYTVAEASIQSSWA